MWPKQEGDVGVAVLTPRDAEQRCPQERALLEAQKVAKCDDTW